MDDYGHKRTAKDQGCGSAFILNADPDPAVFLNADPDPDPGLGPA